MAKPRPDRHADIPAPTPEPVAEREAVDRVAFKMKSHDLPDFDSMRTATRDRFRAIVANPAVRSALGVEAPAGSVMSIPDGLLDAVFSSVTALTTAIAGAAYQVANEVAFEFMKLEPRETAELRPMLKRVLDKYGSELFSKWGDEIGLAALFVSIEMQKLARLKAHAQQAKVIPFRPAQTPPAPVSDANSDQPDLAPV